MTYFSSIIMSSFFLKNYYFLSFIWSTTLAFINTPLTRGEPIKESPFSFLKKIISSKVIESSF